MSMIIYKLVFQIIVSNIPLSLEVAFVFQIGDIVFHPIFGAGKIINIEDREIQGEISKYYVLHLIISQMNIMVPVYSKEAVKIRIAISKEGSDRVFEILNQQPKDLSSKWIDRYKLYCESIKKGDIFSSAGVLRDTAGLSKKRVLSKSDLKYFKEILTLVCSELSLILELSMKEIEKMIFLKLDINENLLIKI